MIDNFPQKFYKFLVKGAKVEIKTTVKENSFVDGYSQRIKIGMNAEKKVLNVELKGMSQALFNELIDFIKPRQDFSPVFFHYDKEIDGQYIIRNFSGTDNGREPCSCEFQLEQDFNITGAFYL